MFRIIELATAVAFYRLGRKVGAKRKVSVLLGDGTFVVSMLTKMDLEVNRVYEKAYLLRWGRV